MVASTVKLDKKLLQKIAEVKPPGQTLAAFVRGAVEGEVRLRRLEEAAHRYRELLEGENTVCEEEAAWGRAHLEHPVSPKSGSRREGTPSP